MSAEVSARDTELDEVFVRAKLDIIGFLECRIPGDGIVASPHCTMYRSGSSVWGCDGTKIWARSVLSSRVTASVLHQPEDPAHLHSGFPHCLRACADGSHGQGGLEAVFFAVVRQSYWLCFCHEHGHGNLAH